MNKCLNFHWFLWTGCCNIDGVGTKDKITFTLSNKSYVLVDAKTSSSRYEQSAET